MLSIEELKALPVKEIQIIEDPEDYWKPPETVSRDIEEVLWFGMDNGEVFTSHVEVLDPHKDDKERWGILSFEEFYGELGWAIESGLGDDFPKFGYFRMEGAEMHYYYDSYHGESDSDFYPGEIRPATLSEIKEQFGEKITPLVFWDQLKAAFKAARRMEDFG